MPIYTQPLLQINLNHLAHNYQALKKTVHPACAAAVVKNNAYGLGDAAVSRRLYQEGCRHFFVAHALEGERIRSAVKKSAIYVLQGMGEDNAALFKKAHLIPVISTLKQLKFWSQNATEDIRPVVQVETGLNRLGLNLSDLAALTPTQKQSFSYVLSHLACADEPIHFMNEYQFKAFKDIKTFFAGTPATLSATDGTFLGKKFHFDMVRLGAGLYGLNPFHPYKAPQVPMEGEKSLTWADQLQQIKLKPVMYISAPVLQIVTVKQGEYIGYGATFKACKDLKVATVSIGYGDGLSRALSNRGGVYINGRRAPIVGRVSMDNIMCDVSGIDALQEGDYVDILNEVYKADDMAVDAKTIGYEILSNLGKGERFCKSYIG